MKKEMFLKLQDLTATAETLGFSLLLENYRANLIRYNRKGEVKSSILIDYDDPNCVQKLQRRLDKVEQKKHKKWEPEFQRLAPALQAINWVMEPTYAMVGIVDNTGVVTYYSYGKKGIRKLSDAISDRLLDMHAEKLKSDESQPTIAKKPVENIAYEGDVVKLPDSDNSHPQECQKDSSLIASLWYNISEERQQKLMESLSTEKQEEIRRCLQEEKG